jgi:hypothetical protein
LGRKATKSLVTYKHKENSQKDENKKKKSTSFKRETKIKTPLRNHFASIVWEAFKC